MFWSVFLAVVIVFLAVVFLLSLGVMISGKAIKGSCGGIAISEAGERVLVPCEHCSPEERKACELEKRNKLNK